MKMIVLLFIFLPLWSLAQWADDFSDGDFISNPTWMGVDSCFTVNSNQQLQSSGTVAGEAYLSLGVSAQGHDGFWSGDMEWRFWIRENFSPSANNYAEVWLMADSANLRQSARGYFLRFGKAGSQDAIELYRKDPDGEMLICKGPDAAIASSFKMAVKVNRDVAGHWTLLTDSDLNDICYIYKEISSSAYDWEVALAILHCARCMDYDEMRDWGKRFPTNRGI